jgi:hypothetical protein
MLAFADDRVFFPVGTRGIAVVEPDHGKSDPPQAGLICFWPGDGVASDVAGLQHAQCRGSVRFVPGRVGQAFGFEGQGAFCDAGFARRLLFSAVPGTISFWVKFASISGEMALVGQTSRDRANGWQIYKDSEDRIAFRFMGAGRTGLHSGEPVRPQTWYHVAVVRSNKTVSLYVGGMLKSTAPVSAAPTDLASNRLLFGASYEGESSFRGKLDEIAFHLRALERAEVSAMARLGN